MSDSEEWDAERIAAECAEAARKKTRGKTRRKRKGAAPAPPVTGEAHDADPPMRDPETGAFVEGHRKWPGSGRKKGDDSYRPEYAERVKKWAAMGATVAEMADWLEIGTSTFYRWRSEYPELEEALRIGREPADNRTERSLYEIANGYSYVEEVAIKRRVGDDEIIEVVPLQKHEPPDFRAGAFWLVNRRPDQWQHLRTIQHQGEIAHVTVDQARRELAEFYANGGMLEATAVDVTPKLAAPESEGAEKPEDPDF